MTEVKLSDGRTVNFPDEMTREEMKAALNKLPGASRPGSDLSTPPGTTPQQAANIPPEMVFDPSTGGFIDTALAAERAGSTLGVPLGASTSFLSGTMGAGEFVDEALGSILGAAQGINPEIPTQIAREARSQFAERNPKTATALQIAGGINSAIPAGGGLLRLAGSSPTSLIGRAGAGLGRALIGGPATSAASIASRVGLGTLRGAVGGATEGALQGAGAANEGDRVQGAQQGALVGGIGGTVFGAGAPLVASGAQRVGRAVLDRFKGTAGIPGLSKKASDQILLRTNADQAAGLTQPLSNDPGAMIVDSSPSLQSLLDQAVNVSPAGAGLAGQRVGARAGQAGRNLQSTFDDVMGGPGGIRALTKTISDDARPATRAAYQEAYSTPIDYSTKQGRAIEDLLGRLPVETTNSAIRAANDTMRLDGIPAQILADVAEDGSVVFREMPNVIQLDYIKRAFDEVAQAGVDPITGGISGPGARARRAARMVKQALSDAVPSYGTALETASDGITLKNATITGTRLLSRKVSPEVIREWAEGASDVERRALAAGLRSDIDARMGNVTRSVTSGEIDAVEARKILKDMSSRFSREKVTTALGEDAAGKIFESLDQAQQALLVQAGIAKGSQTAGRLQGDLLLRESMANAPGQIARDIASGGILEGPRRIASTAAGNTPLDIAGRQEAVQREIADYLTSVQGPQSPNPVSNFVQNFQRDRSAQQASQLGQGFGGTSGLLGYLLATQGQRAQGGPR